MANVNVTIRMDENLKKEADDLFNELGMSLTTAITLFTKQAIREQRIPFDIAKLPNKETLEALKEYKEMNKKDSNYKRYEAFEDLLKELNIKWSLLFHQIDLKKT